MTLLNQRLAPLGERLTNLYDGVVYCFVELRPVKLQEVEYRYRGRPVACSNLDDSQWLSLVELILRAHFTKNLIYVIPYSHAVVWFEYLARRQPGIWRISFT